MDKLDSASIVVFEVRAALFSRPRLLHRKFFPAVHCSRRTISAALFTTEFCLPTMSAADVAGNIGRHLIWTRTASFPFLLLLLPVRGIVFLRCCDSCAVFRTFFSVANTLWNTGSVFIVLTCACQISGVILVSLFSLTLLPVASATAEITQRPPLRRRHLVCVKETSQVRFFGGNSVLCMCSFYVCIPY